MDDNRTELDSRLEDMDAAARKELDELGEQAEEDLFGLSQDALVKKHLELQRAYISALNAVMLFKRQLSALRDHTLRSGQIADLSRKVNIADIDIITNVAIREVPYFFQAQCGALFLYDRETELLTLQSSVCEGLEQPALHMINDDDTLLVNALVNNREPMAIAGFEGYESRSGKELRRVPVDKMLDGGALLCPLVIGMQDRQDLLVGALVISGKSGGFTRHDVDMAGMMSEMLATAISTSRLIEQISHLAETDGLTQLYNHRHFQQELDRAIARAARYGNPLSLAMIDIDFFKKFNDTHGHQAGDHVLKEVSRLIRMTVRDQVDIAARYGGEEFALVMPDTDLHGGHIAAERLRRAVESAGMIIAAKRMPVTISVGVAQFLSGEGKGSLIDRADGALYKAKRAGRNRVATA